MDEYFDIYCDFDIPSIEYSMETYEYCYYNKIVNAFYDNLEKKGSFHICNWYTRMVPMPYECWKYLITKITEDPANFSLTKSEEPFHTEGELLMMRDDDGVDDAYYNNKIIHPTGWKILAEDGKWHYQYEADGK